MGLDNPIHLAILLMILLLVFGAKRLPEMGKSLGHGLRGFKESISGEDSTVHLTEAHAPVRVDEQPRVVAEPVVAEPVVAEPVVAEPVAARTPLHPAA